MELLRVKLIFHDKRYGFPQAPEFIWVDKEGRELSEDKKKEIKPGNYQVMVYSIEIKVG